MRLYWVSSQLSLVGARTLQVGETTSLELELGCETTDPPAATVLAPGQFAKAHRVQWSFGKPQMGGEQTGEP